MPVPWTAITPGRMEARCQNGAVPVCQSPRAGNAARVLMTAMPHNGKDEDFQLFLSLLDSDRFYGTFRDGVHKVDALDLIRRIVQEEHVEFDIKPLFQSRITRPSPVCSVHDPIPEVARRQALVRVQPRRIASGRIPRLP